MKPYLSRVLILVLILAIVFAAMGFRLNYMMNSTSDAYATRAESRSTKTLTLYGKRGTLYDTNMIPIGYDRTCYNVTFYRDPSKASQTYRDAYTQVLIQVIELVEANGKTTVNDFWMKKDAAGVWRFNSGSTSETVEATRRSQWVGNFSMKRVAEEDYWSTLCSKYGIPEGLDEEMTVKVLALWQESRMNAFNSTPCVIAYDVGYETMCEIEARMMDLDGIDIEESYTRVYPLGTTACHISGYTARIPSESLESYLAQGYPNNAQVGVAGIESYMEEQLSPYIAYRQGSRIVERDTRGKVIRDISYTAPQDGNSVILTVDTDLEAYMRKQLQANIESIHELQETTVASERWQRRNAELLLRYAETGREIQMASTGAIVAMDPNSGRILGMVSLPDYNLTMFQGGNVDPAYWQEIASNEDNPMFNRCIAAKDTPGSIFKLCTALGGLSEGAITLETRIDDLGSFTKTDATNPSKCWTTDIRQHQNQTIVEGLGHSCNFFFYEVGYRLGSEKLYKWAAALGLTSRTNVELPGEATSFVGNQDMLYDPDRAINDQYTARPVLVANSIRDVLLQVAEDRGTVFDSDTLESAIKSLMDITTQYSTKAEWNTPIREVLVYDLGIPREYVSGHYMVNTMVRYLQELFWTANETIMAAIGQSITQLTPIAVARYVCAIANGGTVYDAQIIDKIIAPDGTVVVDKEPVVATQIDSDPAYFAAIRAGMEMVTDFEGTAAKQFQNTRYNFGAKTGTSERTDMDIENNSWLVCYAPAEDPQIVVVVYIQNGYSGAYSADACINTAQYYLDRLGYSESASAPQEFSIAD